MAMVSPSILSADFVNLERDLRAIARSGADYIHVDVMDGLFVPNLTIGMPVVQAIARVSQLPLDVHLMIDRPIRYVDGFCQAGASILAVHLESDTPEGIRAALELSLIHICSNAQTVSGGDGDGSHCRQQSLPGKAVHGWLPLGVLFDVPGRSLDAPADRTPIAHAPHYAPGSGGNGHIPFYPGDGAPGKGLLRSGYDLSLIRISRTPVTTGMPASASFPSM